MLFAVFFLYLAVWAHAKDELQNLENENTFLYFGYGSNLLSERIHKNTNAVRAGIGKLKNYRLDFDYYSNRWHGYAATIVPDERYDVWGALWKINKNDLDALDRQEGVSDSVYFRFLTKIERPFGNITECYTYQLVNNPKEFVPLDKLPLNRQPSKVYLNTIIEGAKESELPLKYQNMLKTIAHNNYDGNVVYMS